MSEYIIEFTNVNYIVEPIEHNGEIVRCWDCMYYKPDPYPIDPGWPMYCEDTGRDMIEPNGYCAWGIRKAVEQ